MAANAKFSRVALGLVTIKGLFKIRSCEDGIVSSFSNRKYFTVFIASLEIIKSAVGYVVRHEPHPTGLPIVQHFLHM